MFWRYTFIQYCFVSYCAWAITTLWTFRYRIWVYFWALNADTFTSIFTRHVIWHIIFDFHTFLFKEWGRQNLFKQLFLNISFVRLKFAYNVIMQLQYIIIRWKLPQWWLYILFWLNISFWINITLVAISMGVDPPSLTRLVLLIVLCIVKINVNVILSKADIWS